MEAPGIVLVNIDNTLKQLEWRRLVLFIDIFYNLEKMAMEAPDLLKIEKNTNGDAWYFPNICPNGLKLIHRWRRLVFLNIKIYLNFLWKMMETNGTFEN